MPIQAHRQRSFTVTRLAPDKAHDGKVSVMELVDMFPDEDTATEWLERHVWPEGRHCPRCESVETGECPNWRPMPYWCGDCRKYFSVRTGTAIERSRVPLRKWVFAIYIHLECPNGAVPKRLQRDLDVTQKTACLMLQRLREAWEDEVGSLSCPVEVDETYVGGSASPSRSPGERTSKGAAELASLLCSVKRNGKRGQ